MSRKLSMTSLMDVMKELAGEPANLETVMNKCEEMEILYNGDILKGTLQQLVDKGKLIQPRKGQWQKKPTATGGGTPTVMYIVDDPMNPQGAEVKQEPYDEKKAKAEGSLYATTALKAVKKAQAYWYHNDYFTKLEAYRALQDSVTPERTDDAEAA